jgi:hypothetical protein
MKYRKYTLCRIRSVLAVVLAVLNGVSVGLAYVVSQGNITATIIWFGIVTGVTAGLSYNKENQ